MPVKVELLPVTDFTGGLNLRANPLQLRGSESPDMLNVDLDPRGGFAMRNVAVQMNTVALSSVPQSIWSFATTAGTRQVLVNRSSGQMLYSTGGNFTAIVLAGHTTGGAHRATTFKDNCYIVNGTNLTAKWTGTVATELTDPAGAGAYNNDFASPTTGNMPKCALIASHQGSVWCANIIESATAFPNRIRWSHPNNPESWRAQDFIDIDTGVDGDFITAILPFGERLLVFKNNSMHVISGYSTANFQVSAVSHTVGACSQEAVTANADTVYFFSWPTGVSSYTTRGGVQWEFERLYPALQDNHILGANQSKIQVEWINRRLWVSTVFEGGSTNNRVFVLDPTLGGNRKAQTPPGGWTQYDMTLGPMMEWTPPGQATRYLACSSVHTYVVDLEQVGDQDNYNGSLKNIESYYTTKWFDADVPAQSKRWKRPEFIFERAHTSILTVSCFKDFNPAQVTRTFELTPTAGAAGATSIWGTSLWGSMVWGGEADVEGVQIQKGSLIGKTPAVRLRIAGPATSVRWTVSAITFKFQPLRIRA